ncbi:MAG: hypothetical protein ABSB24_09955 [Gaiellaceae bacterium]|jgi:hypothetical protein
MTAVGVPGTTDTRPLVAVVCSVPLLGEAMGSALEFAEVRAFSARGGDIGGLLRWLHPDAVIVDSEAGAAEATAFAIEHDLPVLHISVRDRELRLFRGGEWELIGNGEGPTPESIRNVVAGSLFARGGR